MPVRPAPGTAMMGRAQLPRLRSRAAHASAGGGRSDRHAAHPVERTGPGRCSGCAPDGLEVRCQTRAVEPRRRAAPCGPVAGLDHAGGVLSSPSAPTLPATTPGGRPDRSSARRPSDSPRRSASPHPSSSSCSSRAGSPRGAGARPEPGARRLPRALTRGRRLGGVLRRLRPLWRARSASVVQPRRRRRAVLNCRLPGSATPRPETLLLLGALLSGDWVVADASDERARREASGLVSAYLQWHLERQLKSLPLVERA